MSAALLDHLPSSPTPDDILSGFVGFVESRGLSLYPAQEEAILELCAGKHVVLATPTGSGKSLVALALHFKGFAENKRSIYTCPVKALVNEKFFALCEAFGPQNVGMLTGDATINRDAPILCCTAEILANFALRSQGAPFDYVVMDEFHYYADKERGVAWQLPLLTLEDATFLLMSATLGDLTPVKDGIVELTGKEVAEVRSNDRPVPLDFQYAETPLHETVERLLAQDRAPIYLVNFTQRAAAEQAQNLMSVNVCIKEEKEKIRFALMGTKFDSPFGKELQRFVRHGIGLHHAGLLPKYRLAVEKLAQEGLLKVVSGTDTLGVGVNIPIRTVLFTQLCKYNGEKTQVLSVRDFRQISGRAGRKGFDDQGTVVAQAPAHVVENLKLEKKAQGGKKVVKQKPPEKGYAHWDRATFERLLVAPVEPLESRFTLSHGLVLSLLQAEGRGGYRRLITLIDRSQESAYQKRVHRKSAARLLRSLIRAGIVLLVRRRDGVTAHLQVNEGLQKEFSLHHSLSLYLIETLPRLDPASPTYALDVLSLVEAILESPEVVLYAQLDALKGRKVAELKAQGMEYAERMEELSKLEWPKPCAELIYPTFNAYVDAHPWVSQEAIRPKSIARELFETCASFSEYVRTYALSRSEGVLLRYLSDAYKTLAQNVPEALRTDELRDVLEFMRTLVRRTDSSLLDEWERMRNPSPTHLADEVAAVAQPKAVDPRAFRARVRSELHLLLRALAARDHAATREAIFDPEDIWTEERLAEELAPYFAAHPSIDLTPRSRRPDKTHFDELGEGAWRVRQSIVSTDGEEDWMVEVEIRDVLDHPNDAPWIRLVRVGL